MNKLDACQAKLAYQYKNIRIKLLNTIQNIKFNKTCLNLQLTPRYVQVKIRNSSLAAKKAKTIAEQSWIRQEIKLLYQKKSMLNILLYKKHIELINSIHAAQYYNTFYLIEQQVNKIIERKKRTQTKKLGQMLNSRLNSKQFETKHKFYPRVVNLSTIYFAEDEMSVLNKGLKYNLRSNNQKKHLISEILNAETAINSLHNDDTKNYIRHRLSKKIYSLTNNTKPNSEMKIIKQIKQKLIDENCIISKADKGQTLIIIPKTDYNNKVLDFIKANNITEIDSDPTNKFNTKLKYTLNNNCKNLFNKSETRALKMMDPNAPSFTGLPKLHKDNIPVRPLVNFTSAPSYRLSKKLDQILRTHIKLENNHSLKNSIEFVNLTESLNINSHQTMASFDIVNLYTNVPIEETLRITKDNLLQNSSLSTQAIDELINILKITLKQNYFIFDGKYYMQNNGLAMGSPLSSILSEIYLNDMENTYILSEHNKYANKILFYKRYVDDTFVIFNGNSRQLNLMKNIFNKINNNLQFTLETEIDNKLNFLDLTIEKIDGKLAFNIYRKPTATNHTIHQTSYHPMNHKLAAYNTMIHRMLSIPLSPDCYNSELNTIKYIATANGYESSMIDRLLNKKRSQSFRRSLTNLAPIQRLENSNKSAYTAIEYGHILHSTLKNELKQNNITLASRTTNKLQRLLSIKNTKSKSGVYRLTCSDCPKFYIGQTGRSFEKRFKEHLPKPTLIEQKSKFADHLIHTSHSIQDCTKNLKILRNCRKGPFMNTIETYEIYKSFKKSPDLVLNEKLKFNSNVLLDLTEAIEETRPLNRVKLKGDR